MREPSGERVARFPAGLFVMNLPGFRSRFGFHPPETAGAIDVALVRDKQNFFSIAGPDGIDLHVVGVVVVARKGTFRFTQ